MSPLALLLLPAVLASPASLPDLPCEEVRTMALIMQGGHYGGPDFEETARRAADRYVAGIDPMRTLLLADEAERFRERVNAVLLTSAAGDCSPLEEPAALVAKRAAADARRVAAWLGDDFQVDESLRVVVDPEEAGWPATEPERLERIRAMVHYQVGSRIDAGLDPAEARAKVRHAWELAARRTAERRAPSELPALYVDAFASALDPHSAFFTAEQLEDFRIDTQLSLEGIGAALVQEDGFTRVDSIVPGGPADRDGRLQPGDLITAVAEDDGEPVDVIDMSLQDVVQLIRGPRGTRVTLTVLRKDPNPRTFTITIQRDRVDLEDRAAHLEVREVRRDGRTLHLGLLDLPSFYGGDQGGRSSSADVARLLAEAREKHVEGVALDLSRNGGGLLVEAVHIAGLFVREGAIVATRDPEGEIEVLADEDPGLAWDGPLVVLTSPASASGAEILAGALDAYDRAVVVGMGEHTFGKGTVQQLLPLPGGFGAIKLTTGMFFLPNGRSTQFDGVPSDVVVPAGWPDFGEKDLDWALPPETVDAFPSPPARIGIGAWRPVLPDLVAELARRSAARVAEHPLLAGSPHPDDDEEAFATVGELLGRDAPADGAADGEAPDPDAQHDAFVAEGLEVLADLVVLSPPAR